jgi:hypothetical protein
MIKRIAFVMSLVLLASCTASPVASNQPENPASKPDGMKYLVSQSGSEAKLLGEPFEIPMDNCGGSTEVKQTQEKSRTYTTELNIEISEKVAAEIGGNIEMATAKLSEEVGIQLGVRFGSANTTTSKIEIPIPAGKRTVTTLQWKEEWAKGIISIAHPNGELIETLPFSALNDVVLMQIGTQTVDCTTGDVVVQAAITPQISTPELPVIVSTPVPVFIGDIVIPGNTSEGIRFISTQSGIYVFKYVRGAYSIYPENKIPTGKATWLTALRIFQNRGAEWNGVAISDWPDYNFADTLYYSSSGEAENEAREFMLTASLLKGDYLLFVPVDGKPYYSDNVGEVTIDVFYMPR